VRTVEQLQRIIREFGEYVLYIITPVTRYVSMPCCDMQTHVTNFQEPDFLSQIISDLTKLKYSLRKKLSPAVVLDGIELFCGTGCGKDRVEQTLRAGWASDPVHPNAHIYAKMALNLLEKLSAGSDSSRQPGLERKIKRSESSSASVTPSNHNPAQAGAQASTSGHFNSR
jgi:hypothetical protein